MERIIELKVEDILEFPQLEQAVLLAGKQGLKKTISWVHVLEHTHIKDFVNGNELVLTTGARWKDDEDPFVFLEQLAEKNISALCIQLGSKYNSYKKPEDIPKKIIDKAELNDLPLIVFPENYDCRFIDLIHNVHSVIINKNYKYFLEQEQFLQDLYKILLNPHDIEDILTHLHRYLDINVVFIKNNAEPRFTPEVPNPLKKRITDLIKKMHSNSITSLQSGDLSIMYHDISATKDDTELLAIYSNQRKLSNFEYLIFHKCAISLAKVSIENLLSQEKKRYQLDSWINKWINNEISEQAVEIKLQEEDPFIKPYGYIICTVSLTNIQDREEKEIEKLLRVSGITRSLLEQKGYKMFAQLDKQTLTCVLINIMDPESWKVRLGQAITEAYKILAASAVVNLKEKIYFSIGEMTNDIAKLGESHKCARDSLYLQNIFENPPILFYDDLHIHRIIMSLEKTTSLKKFISKYLFPLVDEKLEGDQALINTLKALRDCQYNKIEAAKLLYVSRQSVYQRIKTIESIMGEDLLSNPEKRLCMETALYALDYLKNKTH